MFTTSRVGAGGCSHVRCRGGRGASFPNGPVRRQARRRRPGSRPLASPFALRRELLPTSPKYLDDTSATPIDSRAPVSPAVPPCPHACSCFAPGHDPAAIYHSHRSEPDMSSVRLPPTPPLPLRPTSPQQRPPQPHWAMHASTDAATDAQDPEEEECQEGYPVLPDGVRRLRYRYATTTAKAHQRMC